MDVYKDANGYLTVCKGGEPLNTQVVGVRFKSYTIKKHKGSLKMYVPAYWMREQDIKRGDYLGIYRTFDDVLVLKKDYPWSKDELGQRDEQ